VTRFVDISGVVEEDPAVDLAAVVFWQSIENPDVEQVRTRLRPPMISP
jgi:hypothetical protein